MVPYQARKALEDRSIGSGPTSAQPSSGTWIGIGGVHATMLHTILRYAMKPDKLAALPGEAVLVEHLQALRDQFVSFVASRRQG